MTSSILSARTATAVTDLVGQQVRESRSVEFKVAQAERTDEFLADVSALANTIGGEIFYGVREEQGVAVEAPGIDLTNPDEEIQRLENCLRTGMDPRIPGVAIEWLPLAGSRGFLHVRVERSWLGPHRVMANSRYYRRGDSQKYPMDSSQIREAILQTETLTDRVKRFRDERTALILSGDSPIAMADGPRLIVHLLPQSAFTSPKLIDLNRSSRWIGPLRMSSYSHNTLRTLEGLVSYSGDLEQTTAYSLLFRDGCIEGVMSMGAAEGLLYPEEFEAALVHTLPHYLRELSDQSIGAPFYVLITLAGVRGRRLGMSNRVGLMSAPTLRRDAIALPALEWEAAPANVAPAIKPNMDLVWNAFGYERSFNFTAQGEYINR